MENTIHSSIYGCAGTSTDAVTNETLSTNEISGLLDNLANGFGIFLGSSHELKPLFCSQSLMELLRITREQIAAHMSRENGYGVHPDDLERARQIFKDAFNSGSSVQDTFRMRTGDGEYRYTTVFANVCIENDGSAKLYCIFSNAEEAEYLRRMQANRYKRFLKQRTLIAEGNAAYILLNITANTCGESYFKYETLNGVNASGTADGFLASLAANVLSGEHTEELKRRFALDSYQKDLEDGVYSKKMRLPILMRDTGVHWHLLRTEMFYNTDTGDMEVLAIFDDIDNEVRMGYVVDRILDNDYEYMCQIDVQTGYITRIGNKNVEDNISAYENGRIRYKDVFQRAIQHLLPVEYWEEGEKYLSLDTILRSLEDSPSYTCTFPMALDEGSSERLCQWSFEYVDAIHSTIQMCRANISKYLDYGFDALTGMYARSGFYRRIHHEFTITPDRKFYIIEIDLDNFSLINKTQGYHMGTRFLRSFGADIRRKVKLLGHGTVVGHLEADHFAILLPMDCGMAPEELYHSIAPLVTDYQGTGKLSLRMGIYEVTDPAYDVGLMCDCAHLALQHCKNDFRKNFEYYSSSLRDKILDEQVLISEMQNALDTEQFEVWFQPQINHARNGSLIGAEALVRWNHPRRGLVSPALFVPLFESNGFIYELDKYVWKHTCQYLRHWLDEGKNPAPVAVNISRIDFMQADFPESIIAIVEEYNIPHDLLHLEVTESAFAENGDKVVEAVKELIGRGFIIAIDDFGSGYSSLSMLRSVPAHVLKLDMRFFEGSGDTLRNECIIESIVNMAKMLGMAVIAEGVEQIKQADFLSSVGCYYIQGYLYSKPLPYDAYAAYALGHDSESTRKLSIKTRSEEQEEKNRSYELFRSIISGSNDIIIVADVKTKQLLYANKAAERHYGRDFDPMVASSCSDYCSQKELCGSCPANSLKLGEQKEFVSGGMKSLYTRIDWNGHDAFVFYQIDISAELRELEFFDSLIRNIPGATIVFYLDATDEPKVRYVSEQAINIFRAAGYEGNNPDFEDCFTVMHPGDRQRVRAEAEKVFAEKCPFREEFRVIHKDGSVMWFEILINPVTDKNGSYLFYGVYADITARKAAQEHLDSILRSIPAAMTIYEVRGDTLSRVFISDKAKEMLMTSSNQYDRIAEDDLYARVHAEDRPRVRSYTKERFRLRKPFNIQFRLIGEDGDIRWVQINSTPIAGSEENVSLFYSIYTDIDAQKQLEINITEADSIINIQHAMNHGLREALMQDTVDASIESILAFAGYTLHAERAYIIEKNPDGTDSNTFEWVAPGVTPEIDNLQNVPEEVCATWYEQFRKHSTVIVNDVEDIRYVHPELYNRLVPQNIHSLIASPLMNSRGEPIGFLGLDNPPEKSMQHYTALAQNVAFFVEAGLKRKRLESIL